jgi:hypothetical protein
MTSFEGLSIVTSIVVIVIAIIAGNRAMNFLDHTRLTQVAMAANLSMIVADMKLIANSKRLSVYLAIEGIRNLPLSAEKFEADRAILLNRMIKELDEQSVRGRFDNMPGIVGWSILSHSGFDKFVDTETKLKVADAMSRLAVNNDIAGIRELIKTAVEAL